MIRFELKRKFAGRKNKAEDELGLEDVYPMSFEAVENAVVALYNNESLVPREWK